MSKKNKNETNIRKIKLTWNSFNEIALHLVNEIKMRKINIDLIIGNSRGGLPLAVYMSHHLGVGTENFGVMSVQRHTDDTPEAQVIDPILRGYILPEIKNKNILIVEDTIGTGTSTLSCIIRLLNKFNPKSIRAVAMFVGDVRDSTIPIIYYHMNDNPKQRQWVIFPWEVDIENK